MMKIKLLLPEKLDLNMFNYKIYCISFYHIFMLNSIRLKYFLHIFKNNIVKPASWLAAETDMAALIRYYVIKYRVIPDFIYRHTTYGTKGIFVTVNHQSRFPDVGYELA